MHVHFTVIFFFFFLVKPFLEMHQHEKPSHKSLSKCRVTKQLHFVEDNIVMLHIYMNITQQFLPSGKTIHQISFLYDAYVNENLMKIHSM